MEIYRRKGSKYWLVDFVVNGQRFRKSTRATTKTRAMEVAAELIKAAQEGDAPVRKGPSPILSAFAEEKFLPFVDRSQLDPDSKLYYNNGWRLLSATFIAGWRMDRITTADAETLAFPGSRSNANCALRTLRRMLSLAKEWRSVPGRTENQAEGGERAICRFHTGAGESTARRSSSAVARCFPHLTGQRSAPQRNHPSEVGQHPVG